MLIACPLHWFITRHIELMHVTLVWWRMIEIFMYTVKNKNVNSNSTGFIKSMFNIFCREAHEQQMQINCKMDGVQAQIPYQRWCMLCPWARCFIPNGFTWHRCKNSKGKGWFDVDRSFTLTGNITKLPKYWLIFKSNRINRNLGALILCYFVDNFENIT